MADILRPPLVSQRQRKRPIAGPDAHPNLLSTTLAAAPAGLNLPLRAGRLFDSAPRKRRSQGESLISQGLIVYDGPEAAIASLIQSAPRRVLRLSLDQPPNLLANTLAHSGLGLPLLAGRIDASSTRRRPKGSTDILERPLTLRFIPSVGPAQLSDSAPGRRRSIRPEVLQRPITLALQFALETQGADHGHSADNVVLQVAGTLSVEDASHAHAVDNLVLVQSHVLAVSDALHDHAADSPELSTGTVLDLQDALHGHLADQPGLTQAHVLVVSEALHGHTAEVVAIFNPEALVVDDALHAHLCDALGVARSPDSSRRVVVVAINRTVRVH